MRSAMSITGGVINRGTGLGLPFWDATSSPISVRGASGRLA